MHYLICFIFSLLILLLTIAREENLKTNAIMLMLVTVIGDGGYYALAGSSTIEKALLANTLTYTIGIFAPMLFFFNICDICGIKLYKPFTVLLYTVQIILFLCVCTAGKLDIFYKTVEFKTGPAGSYLLKSYGPAHTVYIITMIAYLTAILIISFHYSRKKNIVSVRNVDMFIVISFFIIGSYIVERLIHLDIELMPFIYTVGILGILFPIIRISKYSIESNSEIIHSNMQGTGYIVFTDKLLYMSSNQYAKELFPELSEWELEKRIPGNGGRFNTFLRPAFMKYVKSGIDGAEKMETFVMKGESYNGEFSRLHDGKRPVGFLIRIVNVTDYRG